MLFLAVFCGFFAEYQLEHVIEHQREKKFIVSLKEDLKKDTADLYADIPFWETYYTNIDTLREEIEKKQGDRNHLMLYNMVARMRLYQNFEYHDRTIEQLKNAGNFRLVRKTTVSDSLIDYDALIRSELRDIEMQSNVIYQQVNLMQDQLFNSKYFEFVRSGNKEKIDSVYRTASRYFATGADKESVLFQYYNHAQYFQRMIGFRLNASQRVLRKACNLLELIDEEYHLK